MKSLTQADIRNDTRVLVASDLDVSIENGNIKDTFRLDCMLPTLKYIIEKGALPILAGKIGRPDGKVVAKLSTLQLIPYFDAHLGKGTYELLENLRFGPEEEANDDKFALALAGKADIYVNEAFSVSHRKFSSITGVPKYIPAYAGLRLEKEVTTLRSLLSEPQHPFVVIIGGAKLEDKKPVASKFLTIADAVLLGGKTGLEWHEKLPNKLHIPTDYIAGQFDIGSETAEAYAQIIMQAKTILWAGPMGKYEEPEYITGTKKIAEAIITATQNGANSVAGGGDTVGALTTLGLRDKLSFVSTGGGAMLDFLAEGTLPGIEALETDI